jgi:hypothetical protein
VFLAPGVQGFGYQVLGAVKMAGLDFNNPLNDERASWLRGPGQSAGERTDQQPQQQAFRRRSLIGRSRVFNGPYRQAALETLMMRRSGSRDR